MKNNDEEESKDDNNDEEETEFITEKSVNLLGTISVRFGYFTQEYFLHKML